MSTFFYPDFWGNLQGVLQAFPLMLLQAAALLGIISIFLLFNDKSSITDSSSNLLGIMLGCSSFVLSALMLEGIRQPVKLLLITDFLFLAGYLGGWRNALWAALLAFLGRALFGSTMNLGWSAFDISFIALASSLLRRYLSPHAGERIPLRWGFALVFWRFLIVMGSPLLIFLLGDPSMRKLSEAVLLRRAVSSITFSVLVVFAVIAMIRHHQAREQRLYVDPFCGLPNRRALQRDIEKLFVKNKKKPRALLVIDVNNMPDVMLELGHSWVDVFSRRIKGVLEEISEQPWLAEYSPSVYCFSERSFVIVLEGVRMPEVRQKGIAPKIYTILAERDLSGKDTIKPG